MLILTIQSSSVLLQLQHLFLCIVDSLQYPPKFYTVLTYKTLVATGSAIGSESFNVSNPKLPSVQHTEGNLRSTGYVSCSMRIQWHHFQEQSSLTQCLKTSTANSWLTLSTILTQKKIIMLIIQEVE